MLPTKVKAENGACPPCLQGDEDLNIHVKGKEGATWAAWAGFMCLLPSPVPSSDRVEVQGGRGVLLPITSSSGPSSRCIHLEGVIEWVWVAGRDGGV